MSDTNTNIPNDIGESRQRDDVIFHALKALDARASELKGSIRDTAAMLPLGVDTDLVVFIKKTMEYPIYQLLEMKKGVDETVVSFISLVIKRFFENHRNKILRAFRTDTKNSDLHFSIVLKDDNAEDREMIFAFLRNYKDSNLGRTFPVHFQFIPKHVADKVLVKEIILETK
jgi:hypothetical protein